MISLPIPLPEGFKTTIEIDQEVHVGDLLAERIIPNDEVLSLPRLLGIPIEESEKLLRKNPGDEIKPGDILAVKKGLFGIQKEKLVSKQYGTIIKFEKEFGNLIFRPQKDKEISDSIEKINSPIDGKVSVCNNGKIVIDTSRDVFIGIDGWGDQAQGELVQLKSNTNGADGDPIVQALTTKCIGKIVFGEQFSRDSLIKAIGMGVLGVIGTTIEGLDREYIEQRYTVPILIISKETYQQLVKWSQKNIYIDGNSKTILLLHL